MVNTTAKGKSFEQEVETILRLKGYRIIRNELISGTQIDLVATKDDVLENICFIIECTDRKKPVGIELVKQKSSVLMTLTDSKYLFRLLIVARNDFTAEAKAFASCHPNVILFTLNDLENQLIDFSPYVNWYLDNFEKSIGMFREGKLYETYIELSAIDEKSCLIPILTQEIMNWLKDETNNLIFLLGGYGSGKTSFCRNLAYTMLKAKYRDFAPIQFVPIIINLREYRKASNIQQVITDTLINSYGLNLTSFLAFERFCSSKKIFLILDGFDEMTDRSDKKTIVDCFNQIYLLACLNTKILLTCRSNFFQSHSEIFDLLKSFSINIPFIQENKKTIAILDYKHQGRIIYLHHLTNEQIWQFISKRFGTDADSIFATLQQIHDLSDLSTRPVLLDMILSTLPEIRSGGVNINSAALYQHYTDKWTTRDEWRVSSPLKMRQNFCEVLAWLMHHYDIYEMTFNLLENIIENSMQEFVANLEQMEQFKNDIQTCSFLVRIGEKDSFRFAHKSFVEFFVARKLISDLLAGLRIEKPSISGLFAGEEQRGEGVDMASIFEAEEFFYTGRIATKTFFSSAYNIVNSRLAASDSFLTLVDADFAKVWPTKISDDTVKGHLEEYIAKILRNQGLSQSVIQLNISEEIATFAIEYLFNTGIELEEFFNNIDDKESVAIFSEILRLGKSDDFTVANEEYIKSYIRRGKEELLKIAFCASLARTSNLVDLALIQDAREKMSKEGWRYFLFELANSSKETAHLLKKVFEFPKLEEIDRLICIYGLRETFDKKVFYELHETILLKLMNSPIDEEKSLGFDLCGLLPRKELLDVLKKLIAEKRDPEIKKSVIRILGSLGGEDVVRVIRGLSFYEKDPIVKQLLSETEQRIRDTLSHKKSRVSWNEVRANQAVREKIWRSLRR